MMKSRNNHLWFVRVNTPFVKYVAKQCRRKKRRNVINVQRSFKTSVLIEDCLTWLRVRRNSWIGSNKEIDKNKALRTVCLIIQPITWVSCFIFIFAVLKTTIIVFKWIKTQFWKQALNRPGTQSDQLNLYHNSKNQ